MPASRTASRAGSVITETVTVTEISPRVAELSALPAESWSAGDLTLYITEESERILGAQLPCHGRDKIIREFADRFGANAVRIARAAFESYHGMWMGAPVTVRRFAQGHDEFFSFPILRELGLA